MITVEPLVRNPKIKVEDDKRMFIEHLPLATSVRHVYFAPNAPGYKLFQDRIKFEGLQFDCRISKSPLAKE